jgi:zinc and cadmium transporter
MSTLAWIIGLTVLGGAMSALVASLFLALGLHSRAKLLPHLVSFATGALLGAALLALLPHAIEGVGIANTHYIGLTLLAGILAFFVLEKLVLFRHCHHDDCEAHTPDASDRDAASARLILVGDGFHNVLDGVLIAAAFMTDHHLGIVTAIAVFAHEIPQEVGDLAILLNGGMSRSKAFTLNLLTSLASVLGGVVAWLALGPALAVLPYVIAIAASSFIYVAVADLIPGLHRQIDVESGVTQFVLIALGVAIIYFSHATLH